MGRRPRQQPPAPFLARTRLSRVSCALLCLSVACEPFAGVSAFVSHAKPANEPLEIRVRDYSFREGPQERPRIHVEVRELTLADLDRYLNSKVESKAEVVEANDDDDSFSHQDLALFGVLVMCGVRLVNVVASTVWKAVQIPWKILKHVKNGILEHDASADIDEATNPVLSSAKLQKQLEVIRKCHVQFLLAAEKCKLRSKELAPDEKTSEMMAILLPRALSGAEEISLTEIKVVGKIMEDYVTALQLKYRGIDDTTQRSIGTQWDRLQTLLKSYQTLQHAFEKEYKKEQARLLGDESRPNHNEANEQRRRLELQKLTAEVPQGFTPDTFATLGKALHHEMLKLRRSHTAATTS